jgi:cell pole-organizing protein PopZ
MGDISQPAQDPSMEEILASIKRVIAEDGRVGAARPARGSRPTPAPAADGPDEEDVLELDDPIVEGEGLVSEDAAAASRQSLAALSTLRERGGSESALVTGDGPLEAVVRDMLKPILKEWLDRNLPDIVEELVTREIARISGKS